MMKRPEISPEQEAFNQEFNLKIKCKILADNVLGLLVKHTEDYIDRPDSVHLSIAAQLAQIHLALK